MADSGPSRRTSESLQRHFTDFPDVEFRGALGLGPGGMEQGKEFDPGKSPRLYNLIRAALAPTREPIEWQGMRTDLREGEAFPHVVLDLTGYPEAFTRPAGRGSITISLGLLLILASAPNLQRAIEKFILEFEDRGVIPFDELQEKFFSAPPPLRIVEELLSILAIMHHLETKGWAVFPWSEAAVLDYLLFPPDSAGPMVQPRTILQMARLVSFHEIGHWHMERLMTGVSRSRFEDNTRIGLEEWLSQPHSPPHTWDPDLLTATPEFFRVCSRALNDAARSRFWIKELCVDQLAVSAALNTGGAYPAVPDAGRVRTQLRARGRGRGRSADTERTVRSRIRWYADVAVHFFMLELAEKYELHMTDRESSQDATSSADIYLHPYYSTYPPCMLRRSFSTFVLQKTTGLSPKDFYTAEWGTGFVVALWTRQLMSAMVERLEQEPDRILQSPPSPKGDMVNITLIRTG
jgi:hypothetical protein